MPNALWSEPGRRLKMPGIETAPLLDLDLLLAQPRLTDVVELAEYDLETGRLNPPVPGPRSRTVYLRKDRTTPPTDDDGEVDARAEVRGQFTPCAVCGETAAFGRTSVQDHQTKGDQPFQALVSRQIQVQPPGPQEATSFAPLRGRKVLVFSDSRQVAARLARCFDRWRRFDGVHQTRARTALKGLLSRTGLSRDVLEVVEKALGKP